MIDKTTVKIAHKCKHIEEHTIENIDVEFKCETLSNLLCSDCGYKEWVRKEQHRFSMLGREIYGRM